MRGLTPAERSVLGYTFNTSSTIEASPLDIEALEGLKTRGLVETVEAGSRRYWCGNEMGALALRCCPREGA